MLNVSSYRSRSTALVLGLVVLFAGVGAWGQDAGLPGAPPTEVEAPAADGGAATRAPAPGSDPSIDGGAPTGPSATTATAPDAGPTADHGPPPGGPGGLPASPPPWAPGAPRAPSSGATEPVNGAATPAPSVPPVVVTAQPGQGVTIRSQSGDYAVTLRGAIQARETALIPANGQSITNQVGIQRLRVILAGNVFSPHVEYFLQLAFAASEFDTAVGWSPLYDAYVTLTHLRDLNLRVGQFYVPHDRSRSTPEVYASMIDRSPVVQELNLDRDVGVQVSSNDLGGVGRFAYQLGVFGGDGRNRLATNPGFLYVARVQTTPLGRFDDYVEGDLQRLARPRLAIGLGAAYNQNTTRQRSTTGNLFTLGGFDYLHLEADVMFKFRGLALEAEGLYRQANPDGQSPVYHDGVAMGQPLREWSRSAWGYYLQAGMMLASHWELVARWSQLLALGATDPALVTTVRNTGNEIVGGLNWYVFGHALKAQVDYAYQFGADPSTGSQHQLRLQLQAMF